MLRTEIQEFVSISNHKTFSNLVNATRDKELELETQQQKRKEDQVHAYLLAVKKMKVTMTKGFANFVAGMV